MPYVIRAENDEFAVYDQETDEYLGVLSCPFEQTEAEFEQEMGEARFTLIRRGEIENIDTFGLAELEQWSVFAIDPGGEDDLAEGDRVD